MIKYMIVFKVVAKENRSLVIYKNGFEPLHKFLQKIYICYINEILNLLSIYLYKNNIFMILLLLWPNHAYPSNPVRKPGLRKKCFLFDLFPCHFSRKKSEFKVPYSWKELRDTTLKTPNSSFFYFL